MPHAVALPVRILGTATVLPGRPRTTREIAAALPVQSEAEERERRTGIKTRHWLEPDELGAPLAAEALRGALEAAGLPATALRRIIVVHSGVTDLTLPAMANQVAAGVGLQGTCDAFDVNNACTGFLSGFDIAARSVATGLGPVAVVAAEMPSRTIRPSEHGPYLMFGDAFSAVIVGAARPGEGVLACAYGNDGTLPANVFGEHPSLTGTKAYIQLRTSSDEIAAIAFKIMSAGITQVLKQARVRPSDVDWLLLHQPNGAMDQQMVAAVGLDPARMVPVVEEIGSVGAAAIPVSLDRLLRTRPVRPGDRILMAGVGAGGSYGAVLYQIGG